MRPSGRPPDQMRTISIEPHFTKHAEGSVLIGFGDTKVLVTDSAKRLRSAPNISDNWRRRVSMASSACASTVGSVRVSGRTVSAQRARISATIRSVFASCPVVRAKSRTWQQPGLSRCTPLSISPHVHIDVPRATLPDYLLVHARSHSAFGVEGSA